VDLALMLMFLLAQELAKCNRCLLNERSRRAAARCKPHGSVGVLQATNRKPASWSTDRPCGPPRRKL